MNYADYRLASRTFAEATSLISFIFMSLYLQLLLIYFNYGINKASDPNHTTWEMLFGLYGELTDKYGFNWMFQYGEAPKMKAVGCHSRL